MKFTIQQITDSRAEEVLVKCCDSQAAWVEKVRKVVSAQNTVGVYKNGAFYRLELSDIYYFEVVDGHSYMGTVMYMYRMRSFMNSRSRVREWRFSGAANQWF